MCLPCADYMDSATRRTEVPLTPTTRDLALSHCSPAAACFLPHLCLPHLSVGSDAVDPTLLLGTLRPLIFVMQLLPP